MRVVQLIDSLQAGGAERMAVTLANTLADSVEESFICVTRKEGVLKETLNEKVSYLFLKKTGTIDFRAVFRLAKWVKDNDINIIHAHNTSFFLATLVKIRVPKVKLFYHEHHGNRSTQSRWNNKMRYLCSFLFKGVLTANTALRDWSLKVLAVKQVIYLPNMIETSTFKSSDHSQDRIICVANFRDPKNHLNLVRAFRIVSQHYSNWKLDLVGADYQDSYSKALHAYINEMDLSQKVYFHGQTGTVKQLLANASIGVLASDSEGLPMALLEYGAAGLAVITTAVGQCPEVIANSGKIVPVGNSEELAKEILYYIENPEIRKSMGNQFRNKIDLEFSVQQTIKKLLKFYNE